MVSAAEPMANNHTMDWLPNEHEMMITGIILFSVLIPLGILFAKFLIKDGRVEVARRLAYEFPSLAQSYAFLFAIAKYCNGTSTNILSNAPHQPRGIWTTCKNIFKDLLNATPSYFLPVLAYTLICFSGFYTALAITVTRENDPTLYHFDNYLLYGIHAAAERPGDQSDSNSDPSNNASATTHTPPTPAAMPNKDNQPERRTATSGSAATADEMLLRYGHTTIAVSVAAFIGAYLWTLIFLARRLTNFDLSPFSFLRSAIQICLAVFVCIFLRHLYDSIVQLIWPTLDGNNDTTPASSSWLLALCFLIGFYPALGLNYLQERFPLLHFKKRSAQTDAVARELPLQMIDGIDSYIEFRLGEYEIEDIENLALANPIQLYIETPYSLRQIVDWVGQAQLILEVDDSKILELRKLNVRTSLDFLRFGETDNGKKILMGILHPVQAGQATDSQDRAVIMERLRTFGGKQHVKALGEMIYIITGGHSGTSQVSTFDIRAVPAILGSSDNRNPPALETFARVAPYRDGAIFAAKLTGMSAWERHPRGDEIIQVVAGATTLIYYYDDRKLSLKLNEGMAAVIPQNTWHQFDAAETVSLITATPLPTERLKAGVDDPHGADVEVQDENTPRSPTVSVN